MVIFNSYNITEKNINHVVMNENEWYKCEILFIGRRLTCYMSLFSMNILKLKRSLIVFNDINVMYIYIFLRSLISIKIFRDNTEFKHDKFLKSHVLAYKF